MLQGWSAQWAELWALAQELRQTEGKRVNIYTDSSYAFATLHVHETIYKDRGLLTAGGGERRLKKKRKFSAFGSSLEVAVIHCKGHQEGTDSISKRNRLADQAAKDVVTQPSPTVGPKSIFKVLLAPELPLSKEEDQWALNKEEIKEKEGWWKLPEQRLFVPSNIAIQLVKQHFETTHLGKTALEILLSCYYFIPKFPTLCAQISARCVTCLQNNASQRPRPNPGVQTVGILPFEDL